MITINKIYVEEQTINKSVFICTLIPINSNEEAVEELNKILTHFIFKVNLYTCIHNICNSSAFIKYKDMKHQLRSAATTEGRRMAGARALWVANGMKKEQIEESVLLMISVKTWINFF